MGDCYCSVALSRDAWVGLQCVTVLFPDHLFLLTFRKSSAFCQMPNFTKDRRGRGDRGKMYLIAFKCIIHCQVLATT